MVNTISGIFVSNIVSCGTKGRPILAGAAEANIELVLDMCNCSADLGCRAVILPAMGNQTIIP